MLKESYDLIGFIAIPFISIILVLIPKKKRIWLLPFISFALYIGWTTIVHPEYIMDNLGYADPNDDFTFVSGWWLLSAVPRQIFASMIAAVIAFAISKREKPTDSDECNAEQEYI